MPLQSTTDGSLAGDRRSSRQQTPFQFGADDGPESLVRVGCSADGARRLLRRRDASATPVPVRLERLGVQTASVPGVGSSFVYCTPSSVSFTTSCLYCATSTVYSKTPVL